MVEGIVPLGRPERSSVVGRTPGPPLALRYGLVDLAVAGFVTDLGGPRARCWPRRRPKSRTARGAVGIPGSFMRTPI